MAPKKGELSETFLKQANMLIAAKTMAWGGYGGAIGPILAVLSGQNLTAIFLSSIVGGGIGAALGFATAMATKYHFIAAALEQQTEPAPKPDQGPRPSA